MRRPLAAARLRLRHGEHAVLHIRGSRNERQPTGALWLLSFYFVFDAAPFAALSMSEATACGCDT